jgi:hypothetical protein
MAIAAGSIGGAKVKAITLPPSGSSMTVDLETTAFAAGDNYRVFGSPDPAVATDPNYVCSANCVKTEPITAWKRMYVEQDRMFRRGADLRVNVAPGDTEIKVTNKKVFKKGDIVRLIHAPRLDGSVPGDSFYYEDRIVKHTKGFWKKGSVVLTEPVANAYEVDPSPAAVTLHGTLGDAIGVVTSASDLYDASLDYVPGLFARSFVEYVPLGPTENAVPHVPFYDELPGATFYGLVAFKWFENRSGLDPLPNHQHLIGGSWTGNFGLLGETNLDQYPTAPFSWVFQKALELAAAGNGSTQLAGTDAAILNRATTAHELVHTFDVNAPYTRNGGHDYPVNYLAHNSPDECLMAYLPTSANPKSRASGRVGLHDPVHPQSEFRTIRRQEDPLPNAACLSAPCP